MTCSEPGCQEVVCARGLCRYHYTRALYQPLGSRGRYGKAKGVTCCEEGCLNEAHGKGLCKKHYQARYMRTYAKDNKKKCAYCNVLTRKNGPSLCKKCRQNPPVCLVCGFDRCIDRAHIVPIAKGGPGVSWNLFPLCPNHHRLYDRGLLTKDEKGKLRPFIRQAQAKLRKRSASLP